MPDLASDSRLAVLATLIAGAGLLLLVTVASMMPGLIDGPNCDAAASEESRQDTVTIPAGYLLLYQRAGSAFSVPWTVLAGIGAIESDHGRSQAPGVHSGL